MLRTSKRRFRCLLSVALLGTASLTASAASACGGCFVPPVQSAAPILQEAERVLFVRDPQTKQSVVWVEIRYNGPAAGFGWVLPLPKVPKVGVGTSYLFDRLELATRPRFSFTALPPEGCGGASRGGGFGCAASSGADFVSATSAGGSGGVADGSGVHIVQHDQVGPYDYTIVEGQSAAAIQAWLDKNGFALPQKAASVLADHVSQGHVFVAVKLAAGQGVEAIKPISLTMDDAEPCVPLRLTSIAAVDDTTVQVFVAGPGRAIPKNHLHVQINPARLDVLHGGGNYPQVLAAAIDEAAGRAFVTEFAGPLPKTVETVPASWWEAPSQTPLIDLTVLDLTALSQQTSRCGVLAQLRNQGFPLNRETAGLLEQHLGLQADMQAGGDVEAYYGEQAANDCQDPARDKAVDPKPLVVQLQQQFVEPLTQMAAQLAKAAAPGGKDGRLTRLVMRISPDEMTKDPVFAFHPALPDVSGKYEGAYGPVCLREPFTPDATRVTLKGFGSWIFANPSGAAAPTDGRPNIAADPRMAQAPAAWVVELLDETGQPTPIAPADIGTVDMAIAGAHWGEPQLPAGLTLSKAPPRWKPPASDGVVPDRSSGGSGGCAGGPAAPWQRVSAPLLTLAAVVLVVRLARTRRRL